MLENVTVINEKKEVSGAEKDYKELASKYLKTLEIKFPDWFELQFCEIADAMKLNPFMKELHAIYYETKDGPVYKAVTGYNVYIKRADRSGKLDGWEVISAGRIPDVVSTITIYRKDWQRPFKHSVRLRECGEFWPDGKLKGSWAKMPNFMCEKVAISQGFRLCFPDELSGMPYTQDELPEPEKTPAVTGEKKETSTPEEMGMHKASELPAQQTRIISEKEKMLKGGPSTDAEVEEINKLMHAVYPDLTEMFTKEEKVAFASLRKDKYTAQELIDAMKIEIQGRFENAAKSMGQIDTQQQ